MMKRLAWVGFSPSLPTPLLAEMAWLVHAAAPVSAAKGRTVKENSSRVLGLEFPTGNTFLLILFFLERCSGLCS